MSSREQLMTELQIKTLVIQERYYRDSYQWEKLRNAYHPDASQTFINISWFSGDIDAFVKGSIKMSQNAVASSHTIQPLEVRINGNKAVVISSGSVGIRATFDGVECDMVSWLRFVTCLERVQNEWKLVRLQCIYDRDSIAPSGPSDENMALKVKLPPGARQSYKFMDWMLTRRGYTISNELPGTDDEESVKILMASVEEWFQD